MEFILIAGFIWLLPSILVGMYASSKGRSGLGFFLLSIVFSPLVGLIGALIVAPIKE